MRRGLEINWTSFARVDTISEKLLSKMKAAGCTAVSFGIESANPAILKMIKKGITVHQIENAIRMCRRVGISPYASFILGLPGETPQTIKETKAFAAKLQQEGLAYGFHILAPFPGTEVRAQSDRFGIRILTDDWSKYDANRAVIETGSVNHRMLDAVVVDWEDQYNRYLGHIHKNIQNGTATEEEMGQLENLENTVAVYDLMMQNQIEACGMLSRAAAASETCEEKGLEILIDRIEGSCEMDPNRLKVALQQVVEDGNLKLIHRDGALRWEWDSFLQVPKMTKVS
ncbi:MAG: radical SAM protein [Deltaproteobacteria bacterium]|nr:radical SAM protein [Deltaproteobacteria bacterium]